jgi:TIR domain
VSKIFISHAADDLPLVEPLVDVIVQLGCGVPAEQIFYSSGSATGVPSGADLNSTLRQKVGQASLVVSVLTPAFQKRPYCIAEMGAAWARVGNLFPVRHPALGHDDLEGVLDGMIVRTLDDEAALDELHERICVATGTSTTTRIWNSCKKKWLSELPTYLAALPQPEDFPDNSSTSLVVNGAVPHWGQVFDSFVDAALYTNDRGIAKTDIVSHVENHTPPATRARDVG